MPTRTRETVSRRMREADLEAYGTQLLALDDWRSLKTDPVSRREWGKGFGEPGMADRLYLRYGAAGCAEVLWIEWKRLGGKARQNQLDWICIERARGALVWLAETDFEATPEAFYYHYRNSGMIRRLISPPGPR